jgi:hypothetical protein
MPPPNPSLHLLACAYQKREEIFMHVMHTPPPPTASLWDGF